MVRQAEIHPVANAGIEQTPIVIARQRFKGTNLVKGRADPCHSDLEEDRPLWDIHDHSEITFSHRSCAAAQERGGNGFMFSGLLNRDQSTAAINPIAVWQDR